MNKIWEALGRIPWGVVAGVTLLLLILGGLVYATWRDQAGYAERCRAAYGRVVEVRDAEICVNEYDKIILVQPAWTG